MHISIGSRNPIKIAAALTAFQTVFPQSAITHSSHAAESKVSDQPMSDTESITGARNRALGALTADPEADYNLGLEGGLSQIENKYFMKGWVVIRDRAGQEGIGASCHIQIPTIMIDMVYQGKEMGDVIDHFFDTKNSKHHHGSFGLFTDGHLSRENQFRDAIICALSRFTKPFD